MIPHRGGRTSTPSLMWSPACLPPFSLTLSHYGWRQVLGYLPAALGNRITLEECLSAREGLDGDFPSGPVVKASPSNAGGAGSSPGQGAKIPYASWPKNQYANDRSNMVTNSIKTLKMVRIKKKILKKKDKAWEE